jgi:F-type H+-transporting ATPase subunit delta
MASGRYDKVAKRYARALFDVCNPTDLDRADAQLKGLGSAWAASSEFRQSMLNPRVGDELRIQVIDGLAALVTLRKAAIFPSLSSSFSHLVNEYRKSLSLEVTVATPVGADAIAAVKERLSRALGGEVQVVVKNDPALIGGLTIRLGDKLLDRSVAGTLQRVASQLA